MHPEDQTIENRIQNALATISNDCAPNISALARQFDVPRTRLMRRWHGNGSRATVGGHNKALTNEQEKGLLQFAKDMEEQGLNITEVNLVDAANYLLSREWKSRKAQDLEISDTPHIVSSNWCRRFKQRHPELYVRTGKSLAIARKDAQNLATLENHYERLQRILRKYGISTCDWYNFDETGYRIGVARNKRVLTFEPSKRVYVANPDNRELATGIETCSADGHVIPSMVIFQGVEF